MYILVGEAFPEATLMNSEGFMVSVTLGESACCPSLTMHPAVPPTE